jgi:hypothetical protein
MKNFALLMLAVLAIYRSSYAQNTFPSAGNVGINTPAANANLSVNGTFLVGGSSGNLDPAYTPNSFNYLANSAQMLIGWNRTAGEGEADFINNKGGGSPGGFSFYDYGNDHTLTHLMRITGNGSVGIRTAHPIAAFQVNDDASKIAMGDASGPALAYGTSYIGFNAARNGNSWTVSQDGANNGGAVIYSSIFGDIYFSNIETTGASDKVLADGDIRNRIQLWIAHDGTTYAKTVKVQTTDWPDYVFKKNYNLIPLSALKEYVDRNQHLPGLPSEKEVREKGLDLGEINKLLTKKIEELTLYLIENQKELHDLKLQVNQLSQQVSHSKNKQ